MKQYDIWIIGCGSIGALKNDKYDSPQDNRNILTWAHAFYSLQEENQSEFSKCYKTNLYFVDSNKEKAREACEKWNGINFYDSLQFGMEVFKSHKLQIPLVIVLASPTEIHYKLLKEIIEYLPDLVIAEKPFCSTWKEAQEIRDIYREKRIPIMVDYSRRFISIIREIKKAIDEGHLGKIQNCRILYNRGFKREACHAIDLMNYFFGEYIGGEIDKQFYICDYHYSDPTYLAYLRFEKCNHVFFHPLNGREFSIFEIDIIGTKARYTLVDHGKTLITYAVKPEPTYGDYNSLATCSAQFPTYLTQALKYAAMNALEFINGKEKLLCTDKNALAVHEIYKKLGI